MKTLPMLASIALSLLSWSGASAATVFFDLQGTAGFGLLAANEPQPLPFPTNSSGGEIGAGITYDDVANLLTISNVGWGSSQGFANLSSTASASHIHVTAANFGNDGTGNFKQTGGVAFTLTRSSSLDTGGVFTNAPILLTAAQETDLLNGKYYINIHTANNTGGELRGFLVAVPEPTRAAFAILGLSILALRRRR